MSCGLDSADLWHAVEVSRDMCGPGLAMPWHFTLTPASSVQEWGTDGRFNRGIVDQFDIDLSDTDAVMEQLWSVGLGYSEMPVAMFKKEFIFVRSGC